MKTNSKLNKNLFRQKVHFHILFGFQSSGVSFIENNWCVGCFFYLISGAHKNNHEHRFRMRKNVFIEMKIFIRSAHINLNSFPANYGFI